MDEFKLRIAFAKVKKDILSIQEEIKDLKDNKVPVSKKEFENFRKNVEDEFKRLNLSIKEISDKIDFELKEIKKEITNIKKKNQTDKIERMNEGLELVSEKIDLEIGNLRLELSEEIAKIYDKIFLELNKLKEEFNEKEKTNRKREKIGNNLQNCEKKPNKIKKVINWLFIDED